MGPTTSNHLQATVAEPSGLLAEEQTVKSGQGGFAVPKIIPGGPHPCSGKHLANSPAVQIRKQLISDSAPSPLTTSDSFRFWSHTETAVDQSPTPVAMHPAPGGQILIWQQSVSLTARELSQALEFRVTMKTAPTLEAQTVHDIQHLVF